MDPILEGLVREFQTEKKLTDLRIEAVFETFTAYCIVGQHYEDTFDPDALRNGGPRDLGIDAVAVIINREMYTDPSEVAEVAADAKELAVTFVVIQAKTSDSYESEIFTRLSENLHNVFRKDGITFNASKNVLRFRACIDEIYKYPKKIVNQLPRLSVYYATGSRLPAPPVMLPRADAAIERLAALKRFETISFRPVGSDELQELYRRTSDAVSAHLPIVRSMDLPNVEGAPKAYVGLIKAIDLVDKVLADPAGNIRYVLFDENVRAFLGYGQTDEAGVGKSVNAGIRRTLRNPSRRSAFVLLNNGLTMVAKKAKEVDDGIYVEDLHIVNGCQTCYVLFDERDRLGDNTYITARIVETTDEELITDVVDATNRQNLVTPDDLAAREKMHRDIEAHFARQKPAAFEGHDPVDRRLYYERRTGQYSSTIEGTRIIRKRHLIKAYASMFLGEAHRATRVSEIADTHDVFQSRSEVLPYYTAATALYRFEWMLRNKRIPSLGAARFHMIAAAWLLLMGPDSKPTSQACNKVLDVLWHPARSEALGNALCDAVLAALREEEPGARLGDLARTTRFKLNVMQAVLEQRQRGVSV